MQEKPPFSSYFDFFPNVWEGDTHSHTHPLRTFILPSGTPLAGETTEGILRLLSYTCQSSFDQYNTFSIIGL